MSEAKEIVTRLIELAGKRDAEAMAELMADDIIISLAGSSPLAGRYEGKEGFFQFFAMLQERSGRTFMPVVHEILGEGEHAVALLDASAERDGRRHGWSQANVYHVRDGKVTEVWIVPQDQARFDDFWS